jgi:hypothetical protein
MQTDKSPRRWLEARLAHIKALFGSQFVERPSFASQACRETARLRSSYPGRRHIIAITRS